MYCRELGVGPKLILDSSQGSARRVGWPSAFEGFKENVACFGDAGVQSATASVGLAQAEETDQDGSIKSCWPVDLEGDLFVHEVLMSEDVPPDGASHHLEGHDRTGGNCQPATWSCKPPNIRRI